MPGHARDAAELLMDALTSLAICSERPQARDDPVDLILQPDGFALQVKHYSLVTPNTARQALTLRSWQDRHVQPGAIALIVVGDRITTEARQLLKANDAGFYDLRGHLTLRAPGIIIDTDVEPVAPRSQRRDALSGRAGLEIALALLSNPDQAPSVREIARTLRRSPSTVSEAISALKRENLIDGRGRVSDPQLFWQVAERWPTTRTYLKEMPTPGSARLDKPLRLGVDSGDVTGWALTESAAAVALGAPLAFRPDQPLDFFVPDEVTLRRARSLLGASPSRSEARCSVRVAPAPAVCAQRLDSPSPAVKWPLAQPVVVALDLAQDHGRGREVLEAWTPRDDGRGGGRRVW